MSLEDLKKRREELLGEKPKETNPPDVLDDLKAKREQLKASTDDVLDNMEALSRESERVADVAHHSREVFEDLDDEFEKKTGLNKSDAAFLGIAIALQVFRIYMVNQMFKIEPAGDGEIENIMHWRQKKDFDKNVRNEKESASKYYAPYNQIISVAPVPYDAQDFLDEKKDIFKGANHRFSTLAHDPVIGLVVGTANILTNTITCVDRAMFGYMRKNSDQTPRDIPIGIPDIRTYHVVYKEKPIDKTLKRDGLKKKYSIFNFSGPKISDQCSSIHMLDSAICRLEDDTESVVAALIKQVRHIKSDLFTPFGIQIPAENLILQNDTVQEITKNLSMGDFIKVGASSGIAVLINLSIGVLHALTYDESKDGSKDLFAVKTKKIISISNTIATTSNLIWVGANIYGGDKTQIRNLDWGGLLVALYNLTHNAEYIRKIKEEYVIGNFNKLIQGDDLQLKEIPEL